MRGQTGDRIHVKPTVQQQRVDVVRESTDQFCALLVCFSKQAVSHEFLNQRLARLPVAGSPLNDRSVDVDCFVPVAGPSMCLGELQSRWQVIGDMRKPRLAVFDETPEIAVAHKDRFDALTNVARGPAVRFDGFQCSIEDCDCPPALSPLGADVCDCKFGPQRFPGVDL